MNLFVIGNGFDKAHKIKTDYIDFRDFLYENYPDFLASFEETYGNCLESNRELVNESLWKTFEANLCNVAEDEIVETATSFNLGLEGGDIGIEDTMTAYWDEQYSFILKLQDYLREWINTVAIDVPAKTSYISPSFEGEDDVTDDVFLTFNYTLVLENVYKICSDNICHIHGSIADSRQRLVIGHGNKDRHLQAKQNLYRAHEEYDEKAASIYRALADYYERTEKDVPQCILNNHYFFSNLSHLNAVYIVGHSLGEVDSPYFSEILKHTHPETQWIVVYRNCDEIANKKNALLRIGIENNRISFMSSNDFFNI